MCVDTKTSNFIYKTRNSHKVQQIVFLKTKGSQGTVQIDFYQKVHKVQEITPRCPLDCGANLLR